MLLAVLLLQLLLYGRHAAAEPAFPPSLLLLPLDSFSNTSLVAPYHCNPTYATQPCSGHGDCLLLFDAALPSSARFLNASSAYPTPASSLPRGSLDPADFGSFDMLPAAVCACHQHWTGKGDYINHLALDGDSCGVSQQVVLGVSATLFVMFVPLLLLSIHRLYRWLAWLDSFVRLSTRIAPLSPHRGSTHSQATASEKRPRASMSSPSPKPSPTVRKGRRPLLHALHAHSTDITLVHPFCSLVNALCLLAFLALRIWTDWTIGTSWVMAVLMYAQHIPSHIAVCANTMTRLRLASALAGSRSTIASFRTLLQYTKWISIGVCLYAMGAWTLVLVVHGKQGSDQQLYAMLVLFVAFTSDFCMAAVVMVVATRYISRALTLQLERLSAEQCNQRLALAAKMRTHATAIAVVFVLVVAAMVLVSFPAQRQAGIPYFALLRLFITIVQLIERFRLIQPPKQHTTVAPPTQPQPAEPRSPRALSVVVLATKPTAALTNDTPARHDTAHSRAGVTGESSTTIHIAADRATSPTNDSVDGGTTASGGSGQSGAADESERRSSRVTLPPLPSPPAVDPSGLRRMSQPNEWPSLSAAGNFW